MLKFTKDHEWLRVDGDVVTFGITTHAQEQLGDIVFVELPKAGRQVRARRGRRRRGIGQGRIRRLCADRGRSDRGQSKRSSPIPSLINSDPMAKGWFVKLKIANPSQIDALMDERGYQSLIG